MQYLVDIHKYLDECEASNATHGMQRSAPNQMGIVSEQVGRESIFPHTSSDGDLCQAR